MGKKDAKVLLDKYLAGACTPYEKRLVEDAYNKAIPPGAQEAGDEQYARMRADIWREVNRNILAQQKIRALRRRIVRISAAAVILIALGTGFYFYFGTKPSAGDRHSAQVIEPGGNKATLVLSDGRTIDLSSEKTGIVMAENGPRYNDGSQLEGMDDCGSGASGIAGGLESTSYITLSTPRGGQYQVSLPDGSKVWLNAASSMSYPSSFEGADERRVKLTGEAYFEVARDGEKRFVVESGGQVVEVLGTHFNINSYPDEPAIRTTLLEGKVRVSATADEAGEGSGSVVLQPGSQSIFSEKGLRTVEVNAATAIDWKNGEFAFRNEGVESIMRKLSRWYDVSVEYQDNEPNSEIFSGTLSRFDNIMTVLHMMEATGDIRFRIDGRKVLVFKPEKGPAGGAAGDGNNKEN